MARRLIVTADDFGRTPGINRGIIQTFEDGIVTSASLMVRWPAAQEAAQYARRRPDLAVGLHVDLGEWRYRQGQWEAVYQVVSPEDPDQVAAESARQLARFRELLGRDPTHLDSHQHVHRADPARSVLLRLARDLRVPLRAVTAGITYCGDFHGQTATGEPIAEGVSVASLLAVLASLPEGTSELACHPGLGDDAASVYAEERNAEVETLCDPRVRDALAREKIALCSFDVGLTPSGA